MCWDRTIIKKIIHSLWPTAHFSNWFKDTFMEGVSRLYGPLLHETGPPLTLSAQCSGRIQTDRHSTGTLPVPQEVPWPICLYLPESESGRSNDVAPWFPFVCASSGPRGVWQLPCLLPPLPFLGSETQCSKHTKMLQKEEIGGNRIRTFLGCSILPWEICGARTQKSGCLLKKKKWWTAMPF